MTNHYLLSIDQGTTSSRAIIFSREGQIIAQHQLEITQSYPQDGWVEHDPEQIWQTVLTCCRQALATAKLTAKDIAAIGISNQRETTVIWDKNTHQAIYPAIVWQDRRTAAQCQALLNKNLEEMVSLKTGLLLDPYFSATKIAWILDNVPGARRKAENNQLAFGTIDSYLLWRLSNGRSHYTDATNASRTLLFNIHRQEWDVELLSLFNIPHNLLPQVLDCSANFGHTEKELFDTEIPISGIAGDQQAAMIGQACFKPGMIKSTYGTGCFVVLNTGSKVIQSKHRLISTVAYRFNNKPCYAVEGSIFVAGAAIQWLRDALHLIKKASETQDLAQQVSDNGGVYLVPAFTGLGAPYWDPLARGMILGLTRDSGVAHIVRAALEAVCYQTRDLIETMQQDGTILPNALRVDGGMVGNDWLMQFLADLLNLPVERPTITETSALGAAYLAGLQVGVYQSTDEIAELWKLQQRFQPNMDEKLRKKYYDGWQIAVKTALS